MSKISFLFRWGWVLSVALIFPVSLPAGGAQNNNLKIYCREKYAPILSGSRCKLMASPSKGSPILYTLPVGTPMRVLRVWHGGDGISWLRVQIPSVDITNMINLGQRGWIIV